uniref:ZP domain-containing protein n=1 Tax=Oryzias sinensis TaxID=183150 RepID=A0A8C7Y1Q2_9TELE
MLQTLLLLPLVSASHHFGGTVGFSYKGTNPDGSFKVSFRNKATYDGCQYTHYWSCSRGNCGSTNEGQKTVIDSSSNAPIYNSQWCETETVETRTVGSDKPFELSDQSCCWVATRNGVNNWRLNTLVDLGRRSDTGKPNNSPDTGVLPFMRVPENCPRSYKPMAFDPDGDRVRCRYGNYNDRECDRCDQPSGFHLDEDSCTLHYQQGSADPRVYGFEMVVEDYSRQHIDLFYSDGSKAHKHPLLARRKRSVWVEISTPSLQNQSEPITLLQSPTSAASRWMWPTSTTPPPTTRPTTRPTTTSPTTTTTQTTSPTTRPTTQTTTSPTTTTRPTTTSPTTTTTQTTRSTTRQSTTTAGTPPYTNTPPLSKLPLQFSLLVDPAVPSCEEGVYLPTFVHPTPEDGARIKAEVNKEVEIKVKAEATHSVMQDLIMSGPSNISMHRSTHNEFVIRWTPMADDLGEHYPICFAVESATGSAISSFQTASYNHVHATPVSQSGIYQTEMRCVLVDVGKEQIKANVVCGESSMRVEIPKDSLNGLSEDHLELSDPTNTVCSLTTHSNSSHVIADFPLNACGTQIEEDDDNLFFNNEFTTVDDPSQLITRKHLMEISFYCQYAKKSNMTVGFTAHRKNVTVWERGFGTFTYQFEFYPDSQYQAMIDPNSYPLEYELGSKIYMEIEASSSLNNTEMFVESCRASPYDNPNYHSTYAIIDNGCTVDPTVQIHPPSNQKQFRFSVEAFKFIGLHDQVYISCSVMVCEAGNPNTRCSQGCMNSSSSNHHHHIHKREATVQSRPHFISQGPLRLHSDNSASAINLNLNLVFIAGCLLATVGMICGVVVFKTKMSKVRYQPLPTYEN